MLTANNKHTQCKPIGLPVSREHDEQRNTKIRTNFKKATKIAKMSDLNRFTSVFSPPQKRINSKSR